MEHPRPHPYSHFHTRGSASDWRAVLLSVVCAVAVLWFGSGLAAELALRGVVGSPRTHTALGGLAHSLETADYGLAFAHVVAPLRTDAASTIQAIRIEMRELLPLPWGKGYL